jgi:hypothetical protein
LLGEASLGKQSRRARPTPEDRSPLTRPARPDCTTRVKVFNAAPTKPRHHPRSQRGKHATLECGNQSANCLQPSGATLSNRTIGFPATAGFGFVSLVTFPPTSVDFSSVTGATFPRTRFDLPRQFFFACAVSAGHDRREQSVFQTMFWPSKILGKTLKEIWQKHEKKMISKII